MRMPIARIRIAAGNPGWYDPLTNIHLTITRPEAFVYEGQNPTNIKTAIACKLVSLIEGSLDPIKREEEPIIVSEPVRGQEPKQEEVVVESVKKETVINEVINEEVNKEVTTEEEPKVETKKRTTRKTTTKKKTTENLVEE